MVTRSSHRRMGSALLAAASVSLAGCASDRLADTAGDAAKYVSAFESDLARLQTQLTDNQKQGAAYDVEYGTLTSRSEATSSQAANALALLSCTTPASVFAALQSQGSAATANELSIAAATVSSPVASMPTDKLAAVATGLTSLAKKQGGKADVDFLLAYGTSVSTSMKTPAASPSASTDNTPAKPGASK